MLNYLGGGWLPGVPARNLTDEEVKKYGKKRLINSGLYAEPKTKKKAKSAQSAEVNDGNR